MHPRDLASLAGEETIFGGFAAEKLKHLQAELEPLSRRYDAVVANPPYMGSSSLGKWMGAWVKKRYPEAYRDLCTSFIDRGFGMSANNGYSAMVTMQSWMFLGSFEKLRGKILHNHSISSMAHLGTRAFGAIGGEVVSTTATVFASAKNEVRGAYFRLVDMGSEEEKQAGLLEALANPDCGWFYRADASGFEAIPGSPIAYWASDSMLESFNQEPTLSSVISVYLGMTTADNSRFLRDWWEISRPLLNTCASNVDEIARWAPYNKGGEFRKWYGNQQFVVNWENDGEAIRLFADEKGRIRSTVPTAATSLRECLTWSKISSGKMAVRYFPAGSLFDVAGACGFSDKSSLYAAMAFLNSSVSSAALSFMSPTLNFEGGQIRSLPFARTISEQTPSLLNQVASQIEMSKADWDSFETSWDFKHHPLV